MARTVLTSVGVALGVTTVVGIADVSRSVLAAFQSMVDAVAGEAELEVSSPVGDLPEALVERLAGVAGVAAAAGVIEQFLPLESDEEANVYLIGVDFLGSHLWANQFPRGELVIDDELAFLAQVDSVVVPAQFLARRGMKIGDPLVLLVPEGRRTVVVRGTIGNAPAATLFGGAVVLMDLPAAQATLGRAGRIDRIAVDVEEGVDPAQVSPGLRETIRRGPLPGLAGTLEIASPEARGRQAEQLLFSLRTTLAIMSLGALIVGAFIVYHTIAISVQQRRREFALLNACGVGQRTIIRMCVGETLLLAVPGVAMGVGLGRGLAALACGLVASTASQIWVPLDVVRSSSSSVGTLLAAFAGTTTAVGAAYVAIRASLSAPTIESFRPAGLASDHPGAIASPMVIGSLLIASCWCVGVVPPGVGYVGTVAAVVGSHALAYVGLAVMAAPLVWLVGEGATRSLAPRLPLGGALAVQNLPRQPGRSAGTVATIGAAIGIAVVVVTLVESFERGWLFWVDQHFGADVFVGRGQHVQLIGGYPMPLSLADRIAAVTGVGSVEPFRTIRIQMGRQPVYLQGLSVEKRLDKGGLPMVQGSLEAAAASLLEGTGVLLSENLAYKMQLKVGDSVSIPTADGARTFQVEGIYVDYLGSLDLGAVMVSQRLLEEWWGDSSANLFRVWLEPGVDSSSVARNIGRLLGGKSDVTGGGVYYVLDGQGFLQGVEAAVERFFAATWALEIIAALVGVIGVINSQLATVLDRASELGVLRTIGLSKRDIVRSVVFECGSLGALGGVLGVLIGLVLGAQIVLVSLRLVTGWSMAFYVPWAQLIVAVVAATVVSAVAGYVPARAAARFGVGQRSLD
jgi:putative ABC transport system permease protein